MRATLLALLLAAPLAAAEPPRPSPWQLVSLGLFEDAHRAFSALPETDREARFGRAVTLLNLQPKTDANLDRALALFSEVAAAAPEDELGVSSRYLAARVAQVHRFVPDIPSASRSYRELAALDSPHPLAQRAVVQLALLELFEPGLPAPEIRARFDRFAKRGARLSDPAVVRDFHLVMGDAALRFHFGDDLALDHLLAADRAGIARAITKRDTWLRIARLAERAGRPAVAVEYYQAFLKTFPRDSRVLSVKERLAILR